MYGIYSNKRRPLIKRWGGAAYQLWSKPEDVNSVCLMRKIPVPNLKREKKKKSGLPSTSAQHNKVACIGSLRYNMLP